MVKRNQIVDIHLLFLFLCEFELIVKTDLRLQSNEMVKHKSVNVCGDKADTLEERKCCL